MKQRRIFHWNTGRTKPPPSVEEQAATLGLTHDGRSSRQRKQAQFDLERVDERGVHTRKLGDVLPADRQCLLPGMARESTERRVKERLTTLSTNRPLIFAGEQTDKDLCLTCLRLHLARMDAHLPTPWGDWKVNGSGPAERQYTICVHGEPKGHNHGEHSAQRPHHRPPEDEPEYQPVYRQVQAMYGRPTEDLVAATVDAQIELADYL